MKSSLINREKNEVQLKMEITAEDFEVALKDAYQKSKGKYVVDGFRKGKAPRKLIESYYGEDVFFEDAINELFAKAYPTAIDELGLKPVDRPSVDFDKVEKDKGFEIKVTVTVAPEFEVKDYKGVKVEKIEHNVTDEDVTKELEALQKRNSRQISCERPAKDGDTVLLDYSGFVGDEQFEGGTAEMQTLTLGSNTFIPGFEEQLVGVSVGEETEVKVTFPEEYHSEDLAGKDAVFKCKVHEIKETELPELNDEFAKDISEFDTLEEVKKDIREKLEKTSKDKVEYDTKNAVIEKVYEANEIDIPDVMVEDQIDEMVEEFGQQLRYQGLSIEMYCQYLGKELKDVRAEMKEDAYKKTKTRLIIEAVANAENFEVTEEELEKELQAMADQYKMDLEKMKGLMKDNIEYLKKDIKMRKAVDFMFESAVVA